MTEMLSCVAWATGLAFDRHGAPLYQLLRLSAVDDGVDGEVEDTDGCSPWDSVLSESDCCSGVSCVVDIGGILRGRVLSDWVLSGSS